jgi:NTP pyrophosphatase (non-canonical NTP hydrolase)
MLIQDIVENLLQCPGFKLPTREQALVFLVSEVGELADAITRTWPDGFIRMDPNKYASIGEEVADVIIMACILAKASDRQVELCVQEKMEVLILRYGPRYG